MNASNSKLSKFQKQELKAFKAANPTAIFTSFPNGVTLLTVANISYSGGRFSVSIASQDEKRLRRKVGEFHAAMRFESGESLPYGFGADLELIALALN